MNKKKIVNDPVYGFITIRGELIFDIIEHPYFQRLRRIKQLGFTDYVYPGALHTRFHHALGAMHLMQEALDHLRSKGHEISEIEFEGASIAILLHDIGHGPFSHALENTMLESVHHEDISLILMQELNKEFNNGLKVAIDIFTDKYERPFFHQLVSSQLDIDRMDYLQRDCYFTGVSEGAIGADRIIKMLDIVNNQLVVEEKGIYSIENFLNARRLMYWQVYLHKTAISAEQMMILLFKRAQHLAQNGYEIVASPALKSFLGKKITKEEFTQNKTLIENFTKIDDFDVWGAIKFWLYDNDLVLSTLSKALLNRKLFKITLSNEEIDQALILDVKRNLVSSFNLNEDELSYFYVHGTLTNAAYISQGKKINILTKKGMVLDVADASELPNIKAISGIVKKHYLCSPKITT